MGGSRIKHAVTDEAIAERRLAIVNHTAAIISNSGVDGCSFAAVSEASGFSIGMIQHYFRTRDRLILATIDHRIHEAEEEWREIASRGANALAKIRDLLTFSVEGDRSFADAWGFWLELYAASHKDPAMRQEVNTILELWRKFFLDVLEEAVAEGSINPVHDPEDAARLLLAVVDGLAIQTVNGTYGSSPEDMRRLLYRFAAAELGVDTSAWESTLACAAEH
ncbi:TetR/AcrR family transcriptional regulator [Arthrobacter crystallopoietes]|uniref:TetR/AcrR family transcriptional regulator n=1 Tax=Crystallibacter crystallopoietes TaxID=37928 RepID=UPI0011112DB4|nr:TetR family transcriptional regulator C-terminal domain-containing protein [Arthrobacter crystallopoietes]QTG79563.1 TetR family transcriptional regulator C-terminal domain-containing protein [Arthrobacter crystallopoietes]